MSDRYASGDIYACRDKGHHFTVVGSDKTPMKRSLECRTCTLKNGKPTFVAYGFMESKCFGVWRRPAIAETAESELENAS